MTAKISSAPNVKIVSLSFKTPHQILITGVGVENMSFFFHSLYRFLEFIFSSGVESGVHV